jgi:hypothetical protein
MRFRYDTSLAKLARFAEKEPEEADLPGFGPCIVVTFRNGRAILHHRVQKRGKLEHCKITCEHANVWKHFADISKVISELAGGRRYKRIGTLLIDVKITSSPNCRELIARVHLTNQPPSNYGFAAKEKILSRTVVFNSQKHPEQLGVCLSFIRGLEPGVFLDFLMDETHEKSKADIWKLAECSTKREFSPGYPVAPAEILDNSDIKKKISIYLFGKVVLIKSQNAGDVVIDSINYNLYRDWNHLVKVYG